MSILIPQGGTLSNGGEITVAQQPSRTYRIDLVNGRISGMADNLEAIRQAVYKILETNRYEFLIYSSNYGSELNEKIDGGELYIKSELKRRIREALLQDDRITDVTDFTMKIAGDSAAVSFTVVSQYGAFQEEVSISV